MKTMYWYVDNIEHEINLTEAITLLCRNEVVAFPTETVYGLGASATSEVAVAKIFQAKGRPSDNPLIVHISNEQQLESLTQCIPTYARKLMAAFWPGALTLVLRKKEGIANNVTPGLDTVAVRMPNHPVALLLIEKAGPLAAPSANTSGKPSPTTAKHVKDDLFGRIAGIVDGGATGVGVESTVVDCTEDVPVILRPGGITKEQLQEVIGNIQVDNQTTKKPKSPGMKYTHYAPKSPLIVVSGSISFLQKIIDTYKEDGKVIGVLTTIENKDSYKADVVLACGSRKNLYSVATNIYDTLRIFDTTNVDIIISEAFPQIGIGVAIMNRLLKAASEVVSEK